MSHAARCLHCNQDLSNEPLATLRSCPGCGAALPGTSDSAGRLKPPALPGRAASPLRPALPKRPAPAAPSNPFLDVGASAPQRSAAAEGIPNPFASQSHGVPSQANPFFVEGTPFTAAPEHASRPEAARAQAAAPPAAPPQAPFAAAPQQASRPEAAPPQPAQRARPEASHLEAQRAPRASAADLNDAHAELKRGRFHKPLLFGAIAGGALGALFFFTPDEAGPSKQTTAAVSVRADSGAIGASLPPNRIADPETQPHKASPDASAQEAQRPPAERPKGIAAESDFSKAFREAAAR